MAVLLLSLSLSSLSQRLLSEQITNESLGISYESLNMKAVRHGARLMHQFVVNIKYCCDFYFCFFFLLPIRLVLVYLPDWSCSAIYGIYYVLIQFCRMKTLNDLCACERVCIQQSGGDSRTHTDKWCFVFGGNLSKFRFCLYFFFFFRFLNERPV